MTGVTWVLDSCLSLRVQHKTSVQTLQSQKESCAVKNAQGWEDGITIIRVLLLAKNISDTESYKTSMNMYFEVEIKRNRAMRKHAEICAKLTVSGVVTEIVENAPILEEEIQPGPVLLFLFSVRYSQLSKSASLHFTRKNSTSSLPLPRQAYTGPSNPLPKHCSFYH